MKGKLIEEIWDSNGSLTKSIWKYNEEEELIEYIRYEDETVSRKASLIYCERGERGNLVKTIWYEYEWGMVSHIERHFNEQEEVIQKIRYEENGNISSKITWKYEDKGNEMEMVWYKKNGKIDSKTTSKYDNKGNEIENVWYKKNGKINLKTTSKYDDKGNEIETVRYKNGKIDLKTISKYDNKGNQIEKVWYNENRKIDTKRTWKYDDKGNLIEVSKREKQKTGKWKEELTKYECDDQGNWIKKMIFKQQGNKQIINKRWREIEYYQDEE